MKSEEIVPSNDAMDETGSLGHELMPDAQGITKLGHNPFTTYIDDAGQEGGEAFKASSSGFGPAEGEKVIAPEG